MDNTPATLKATLEHYGLASALTGYIPRKEITGRVSWREFEAFIKSQGYKVVTEGGNVYGRVGVRPATTQELPTLRLITRSDHAAQYGSGR